MNAVIYVIFSLHHGVQSLQLTQSQGSSTHCLARDKALRENSLELMMFERTALRVQISMYFIKVIFLFIYEGEARGDVAHSCPHVYIGFRSSESVAFFSLVSLRPPRPGLFLRNSQIQSIRQISRFIEHFLGRAAPKKVSVLHNHQHWLIANYPKLSRPMSSKQSTIAMFFGKVYSQVRNSCRLINNTLII